MKCPICDARFTPEQSGVALPFCSKRCKMIDAKRWLNEEYGVAIVRKEELEEELASWEEEIPVSDPERN